jgi:putative ABC transport system ATP-binding protein
LKQLVKVTDLKKIYQTGGVTFEALRGVSLELVKGDFVAIMGHSGSGKSTLLHLVGGLDRPTTGSVQVGERLLDKMNETALAKFRRAHIGFVFQFFNLVDNLTVQVNVELPALLMNKKDKKAIRKRSSELLTRLGIAAQTHKHPWALINNPTLLLADEPTGNLDSGSGAEVLNILAECHQRGQTILMVTHDPLAAARAQQVIFLHDGQFAGGTLGGDAKAIAQYLAELR